MCGIFLKQDFCIRLRYPCTWHSSRKRTDKQTNEQTNERIEKYVLYDSRTGQQMSAENYRRWRLHSLPLLDHSHSVVTAATASTADHQPEPDARLLEQSGWIISAVIYGLPSSIDWLLAETNPPRQVFYGWLTGVMHNHDRRWRVDSCKQMDSF